MTEIVKRKPGRPVGTGLNGRRRVLSDDEVRRLKSAADADGLKYGLIIRLVLEFALRVSELTGMKLTDFAAASRPRQVTIKGRKGGFMRAYDIPDRLWSRYAKYLKTRKPPDSPWLFPSRFDGRTKHLTPIAVQGMFRNLCERAGIPGTHSIHDLRHTSATRMAAAGDSGVQIASRLRHRDLSSAQVYIDFTNTKSHDKAMLERYED